MAMEKDLAMSERCIAHLVDPLLKNELFADFVALMKTNEYARVALRENAIDKIARMNNIELLNLIGAVLARQ